MSYCSYKYLENCNKRKNKIEKSKIIICKYRLKILRYFRITVLSYFSFYNGKRYLPLLYRYIPVFAFFLFLFFVVKVPAWPNYYLQFYTHVISQEYVRSNFSTVLLGGLISKFYRKSRKQKREQDFARLLFRSPHPSSYRSFTPYPIQLSHSNPAKKFTRLSSNEARPFE